MQNIRCIYVCTCVLCFYNKHRDTQSYFKLLCVRNMQIKALKLFELVLSLSFSLSITIQMSTDFLNHFRKLHIPSPVYKALCPKVATLI